MGTGAAPTKTGPVTGTAVVRARGYCNLTSIAGSDNGINIASGLSSGAPGSAFTGSLVRDWGVMNVPSGSPAGLYQPGWTAERTFPVTLGQVVGIKLEGRHEVGNATNDCSGSLFVEVYSGTLP